jgi:dihydroflavonol-4-reductase
MSEKPLVLVTGGTGFLAVWVIVSLFQQGFRVRTTVRSLDRAEKVKKELREAAISEEQISSLEIVQADLLRDDGWADAMKDVSFVQHVASPFPAGIPKNEDELIVPAREGTLRVLRSARDAGTVGRVVLTSSVAAIECGHSRTTPESNPYTEKDWTDLNSTQVQAYPKSKTLAERAAWDFMEKEGDKLELTVINPVLIVGPALGTNASTSLRIVSELLEGNTPGLAHISYGLVDVRDCANLHVLAMTHPNAKGERFICVGEGCAFLLDIARTLKKNCGPKARKVPTIVLPNLLIRGVAIFLPVARLILPDLGVEKAFSNAKAKKVLGWTWQYNNEQAVTASAESMFKFGLVKV